MIEAGYIVTRDGTRLNFRDMGAGSTIVLLHGWKGSHRLWDKVMVALAQRHRVVVYDLRGMGRSDKPSTGYNFDVMADDLGDVIEALKLNDVTLVGWSMGCTVALSYLAKGGAGVARLALLNGPLRLTQTDDFPHALPSDQLDGLLDELVHEWPESERDFLESWFIKGLSPAMSHFALNIALETPLDIALAIVQEQMLVDHRNTVLELHVPVLALNSEGDCYWPTSLGEWIATNAPDGQCVVLRESGHAAPLEEPLNLARALEDFIASRQLYPPAVASPTHPGE